MRPASTTDHGNAKPPGRGGRRREPRRDVPGAGGRWVWPEQVSREYTHWIDELRAVRETCVLADLSLHQVDQVIEDPDALALLTHLCTNRFAGLSVGSAKQAAMVTPAGNFLGDGILQRLDEEWFVMSGKSPAAHWLAYHAETGDWDVTETVYPKSSETDDDPHFFTYQVQGPNAIDGLESLTDAELCAIPFFSFERVDIAGHEVREAILDAGADHGIRRLGTRAYEPLSVALGWVTTTLVPIYVDEDLRDYREWLDAESFESSYAIAGSDVSEDVTDDYQTPYDLGYDRLVAFDHDFVGRAALEAEAADPPRTRVTLVWDREDFVDTYASVFGDDLAAKFVDLPRDRWGAHFDRVGCDGELVGVSKRFANSLHDRETVSIASVDRELAESGTAVTLVWGEADWPWANPGVEDHAQTTLRATVAPSPSLADRR